MRTLELVLYARDRASPGRPKGCASASSDRSRRRFGRAAPAGLPPRGSGPARGGPPARRPVVISPRDEPGVDRPEAGSPGSSGVLTRPLAAWAPGPATRRTRRRNRRATIGRNVMVRNAGGRIAGRGVTRAPSWPSTSSCDGEAHRARRLEPEARLRPARCFVGSEGTMGNRHPLAVRLTRPPRVATEVRPSTPDARARPSTATRPRVPRR